MLDDNPVLKERLMGVGAFAGIAMFAIGAVDVLVTGGFDFAAERALLPGVEWEIPHQRHGCEFHGYGQG